MVTKKLYIKDAAGSLYACEVSRDTLIAVLSAEFFEANERGMSKANGLEHRGVVEYIDAVTGQHIRLRDDQSLEEAMVPDGAMLHIYPAAIAGDPGRPVQDIFPAPAMILLKLISLFDPFPDNAYTIRLRPDESIESAALQLHKKRPITSGVILCKESRKIINPVSPAGREEIPDNATLIWGPIDEMLDLLDQSELLLKVPNELIQQGSRPVLQYLEILRADRDGHAHKLLECKLAFLGSGAVGKTSLIERLRTNTFDPLTMKTEGIDILGWMVLRDEHSPVKVNVWDFGGQEINYATHKFFLTERTAYVVVTSLQIDDYHCEMDLEYWLSLIKGFAPRSPVVIALNKSDEQSIRIAQNALREKYPQIIGFVETSCATGKGMGTLQQLIAAAIKSMPHLDDLLPAHYFRVKKALEKNRRNYVDYPRYKTLCKKINADFSDEDMRSLLRLLNDLGIIVNITNNRHLEDSHVLKPEWITKGIYQIMGSDELKRRNGRIGEEEVMPILDKGLCPTVNDVRIVLNLMIHFNFCYRINEETFENGMPRYTYYFPSHFPPDRPAILGYVTSPDCLRFFFEYSLLPEEVFLRFIVTNFYRLQQYWKGGCVYVRSENNEHLSALITVDKLARRIAIEITGKGGKRLLLEVLREQLYRINRTLVNTRVREFIVDYITGTVPIDFNDLTIYEEEGRDEIFIPALRRNLSVKRLLYGENGKDHKGFAGVVELVKEGQVREAVRHMDLVLKAHALSEVEVHEWIMIHARFNGVWKERASLPREEYDRSQNTCIVSLLDFIRSLEDRNGHLSK
ncbi:COR domain-containing protein [Flavitalea sp. BT771]|uniref:COR domain-containing protein n=1 Tax=Flavitalea sp. BT771 TaxID=3063329 RepID=UPI0026E3705A|nr:COR domain-containing protein [Flavitalea sp. BT771]MDO6433089.1 COR domain-containing protein [Flavitalea sp. BT771]MDV6221635.1 COR domain-containing protein [Flavitalea sp. BT771]